MKVAHRAFALIGAVALASSLAACGGGPKEVDADEVDPTQGSDAGGSSEESEAPEQGEPFDGSTVTFNKLTEDNVDGLCTELFGEVGDVLGKLNLDIADIDMDSYSNWAEAYEEQVGSTAATFSCHATASVKAEDAEAVHINVASGMGDPRGFNQVSARSDDMSAGMTLQTSDGPDDETLIAFLNDDVLPKFGP
ncbi:MAG: hypothetical protein ACTHX1_09885 [Micrococcaceae bacterium]